MSLIRSPIIPNVPGVLAHQSAVNNGFSTIMGVDFWAPASGGGGGNQTIDTLTITNDIIFNDSLGGSEFSEMIKKGTETGINYDPNATGLETFAINGATVSNMSCSATETDMTGVPIVLIQDLSGVQSINGVPFTNQVITQSIDTNFGVVSIPTAQIGTCSNYTLTTPLQPNTAYAVSFPIFLTSYTTTQVGASWGTYTLQAGDGSLLYHTLFYSGANNPNYINTISGVLTTGTTNLDSVVLSCVNNTTGTVQTNGAPGSAPCYFAPV